MTENQENKTEQEIQNSQISQEQSNPDIEVKGDIEAVAPKKSLTAEEAALRIKKLSEENKEWRLEQRKHQKALEETQNKLKELESKTQERLINAELKVAAQKFKLRDLNDAKKLADLNEVKILENGDINGVEEAIEKLKASKPYLFDLGATTNVAGAPMRNTIQKTKSALEMSPAEYKAAKSQMLHRR